MKKVLILGAGHVTKPIVDYLIEKCKYNVTMGARTVSKAEKVIAGRSMATAPREAWHAGEAFITPARQVWALFS